MYVCIRGKRKQINLRELTVILATGSKSKQKTNNIFVSYFVRDDRVGMV